jgi:hypothetical protein
MLYYFYFTLIINIFMSSQIFLLKLMQKFMQLLYSFYPAVTRAYQKIQK